MAKFYKDIPERAAREALEVVEAISRYRGDYLLALPKNLESLKRHSVYVFRTADYLQDPKALNALPQEEIRLALDRLERERYKAPSGLQGRIADALDGYIRQPSVLGSGLAPEGRKLPEDFIPHGEHKG
mgnify:CR=1 FL=1